MGRYEDYRVCDGSESLDSVGIGKDDEDSNEETASLDQNYADQGYDYYRGKNGGHSGFGPRKGINLLIAATFVVGWATGVWMSWIYAGRIPHDRTLLSDEAYLHSPKMQELHDKLLVTLTNDVDGENDGPLAALLEVSRVMNEDDVFNNHCHHMVHHLGRAAYRELGLEGATNGVLLTPHAGLLRVCNGAYLHGVIESHLKGSEDPVEAASDLEERVCSSLRDLFMAEWECRHGIGHGFLQTVRDERDRQALSEAFALCRTVRPGDIRFITECENGLWMDYFQSGRRFEGSVSFDMASSASSLGLCASAATVNQNGCAVYAPTEYLLHRPRDYEGALRWCGAATESANGSLVKDCVGGVGSQAAKENLRDYRLVETVCLAAATEDLRSACANLAFAYRSIATAEPKMPRELCDQMSYFADACLAFRFDS